MRQIPVRSSIERSLLEKVFSAIGQPPLRLALKDGEEVLPIGVSPVASIVLRDPSALMKMALNPETGFGDGYAEGTIEVEGDLVAGLEAVYRSVSAASHERWYTRLGSHWLECVRANTPRRSRENVHHHYDLTSDFYRLWLDPQLVYTCAYFPDPSTTLEQGQIAKMDYICRKLQLQAGETVAEAGFGWGTLALYMARHYGVRVKAFNLSHEQTAFARQRARKEGLNGQIEFIEDDYRNITGCSDVFVSVGMLEHVGMSHYPDLGRVIHRVIGDSGRGLLHFIGRNCPAPLSAWIKKRIFPGAYTPALAEVIDIFEPWDLSVLDVENLRLHYAKTLEHWLARFGRAEPKVCAMLIRRLRERGGCIWLDRSLHSASEPCSCFRSRSQDLRASGFPGRALTSTPPNSIRSRTRDGFMRCPDRRRRSGRFFQCMGVEALRPSGHDSGPAGLPAQ